MNDDIDPRTILLVSFDLDGTIAESKSPLDAEMAELLGKLLGKRKVAVASGASLAQFQSQFLAHLNADPKLLENLYLIVTNGSQLYRYANGAWQCLYDKKFTEEDKKRIFGAFEQAFKATGFKEPEKVYGILIEDRGSQITFSAYGSLAPLAVKKDWDLDHKKREAIVNVLNRHISDFSVRIGGTSSIDITLPGIDKAFSLKQVMDMIGATKEQTLYIGDALWPGGNDSIVRSLEIHTHQVADVNETKKYVADLLSKM